MPATRGPHGHHTPSLAITFSWLTPWHPHGCRPMWVELALAHLCTCPGRCGHVCTAHTAPCPHARCHPSRPALCCVHVCTSRAAAAPMQAGAPATPRAQPCPYGGAVVVASGCHPSRRRQPQAGATSSVSERTMRDGLSVWAGMPLGASKKGEDGSGSRSRLVHESTTLAACGDRGPASSSGGRAAVPAWQPCRLRPPDTCTPAPFGAAVALRMCSAGGCRVRITTGLDINVREPASGPGQTGDREGQPAVARPPACMIACPCPVLSAVSCCAMSANAVGRWQLCLSDDPRNPSIHAGEALACGLTAASRAAAALLVIAGLPSTAQHGTASESNRRGQVAFLPWAVSAAIAHRLSSHMWQGG